MLHNVKNGRFLVGGLIVLHFVLIVSLQFAPPVTVVSIFNGIRASLGAAVVTMYAPTIVQMMRTGSFGGAGLLGLGVILALATHGLAGIYSVVYQVVGTTAFSPFVSAWLAMMSSCSAFCFLIAPRNDESLSLRVWYPAGIWAGAGVGVVSAVLLFHSQ